MSSEHYPLRLLRWAGILIGIGLVIEVVTLYWDHPTAFLLFAFIGGTFVGTGLVGFLYFLVKTLGR